MKLNELIENPDNPSTATDEDIKRLAGKLERVPDGLRAMRIAYVTDKVEGKKTVISGNKRLRVLKAARGENGEIPDEWTCDVTDMTEAQRREFLVCANISDGRWDAQKLLQMYDKSELKPLMTENALEKLLMYARGVKKIDQINAKAVYADEQEQPNSRRGAVYALGRHRLMCGDSTTDDVKKLVGGTKIDMLLTDPPYNIAKKNSDGLSLKNDKMADSEFAGFLEKAFKQADSAMKPGSAFYIWYADAGPEREFRQALDATGWKTRSNLIWMKNIATFSAGRMDYCRRHEPCYYGWKEGAGRYFFKDNPKNSKIFEDPPLDVDNMTEQQAKEWIKTALELKSDVLLYKKPARCKDHPTMKPIELFEELIRNSTRHGETVLDIFAGSGTTILAAERLERTAYCIEYEPVFCDVIRRRWAETVYGEGCDWQELTKEV